MPPAIEGAIERVSPPTPIVFDGTSKGNAAAALEAWTYSRLDSLDERLSTVEQRLAAIDAVELARKEDAARGLAAQDLRLKKIQAVMTGIGVFVALIGIVVTALVAVAVAYLRR